MKWAGDITMQAAAPGAAITVLDTWDPDPAGASDGDFYSMSGSIYCYDSTYGCLVRPVVYKQANKYLEAYIAGTEDRTAVLAAGFTTVTTNAADNTTYPGWVYIPADTNYWLKTVAAKPMLYYAGYLRSIAAATTDYAGVGIVCMGTTTGHFGFSAHRFDSSDPDPDPGFVKYTAGDMNYQTTPSSTFDLTVSDPPWVEIYLPEDITDSELGGAMAWIGHSKIPVKVSGKLPVGFPGAPRWLIGDGTNPADAGIALKNSWFMRATS
jgi:hypothetical protein